ncbi:ABC transporter ATP-binding protein [Acinetobacter sp. V91_7]|uniref:ABC transporter ATP-binding protein n=1 Tax=unclassified Acinetobacter TaxID=196816 RepID=UPI00287CF109|nr:MULTISPECIES: ABC transporter ATP-binding protein [unclassified Acinetobacter]MDS7935885.1 ABC transporter ATP-binding protein [Acinetobacter sp. V91_4B]MDS7964507.1 ABC transporter ATP-binding protein [Acinetobacter sp. V91_7]MDS8025798.1 ABC transporter ATP-binding protein [Acinetobacter sp. V91_13]
MSIKHGDVRIQNLSLHLGQGKSRFQTLDRVNFEIQSGEFICLLGPSGCGKSTLLGALAGHLPISSGALTVDNETIVEPHPDRGLVFQQHTLFPWKSVLENIAFGLKMKGVGKQNRIDQAKKMIDLVGLKGFEQKFPAELSGGMQQRVEIARVLINEPRILLMDEPFGALDAQTRLKMQMLLLDIWQEIKTSVLFITHDIDEALFLADRVLIMSHRPGRIIEEINLDFERPRDIELVTSSEFTTIKKHCMQTLKEATQQEELSRLNPLGLGKKAQIKEYE